MPSEQFLGRLIVLANLLLDLLSVVRIIRQGGGHVRQRDSGKRGYDFLGGASAHFVPDDDVHDANTVAGDASPAATDPRRFCNVLFHACALSPTAILSH